MKKVLQLDIMKPCREKWKAFPKLQDGRTVKGDCASCNKHVIDFTTWNDERMKAFFSANPPNVCGRMLGSQLRSYSLDDIPKRRSGVFSLILTFILLLGARLSEAQSVRKNTATFAYHSGKKKPIEGQPYGKLLLVRGDIVEMTRQGHLAQIEIPPPVEEQFLAPRPFNFARPCADNEICLRGKVVFDEDGSPAVGTIVVQKGTSNGTTVGEDGLFNLPLIKPGTSATLVFSFIGTKTQEVIVAREDFHKELNIVTMQIDAFLGEIIVTRTISPRRWWWNFTDLLSRSFSGHE